MNKNIENLKLQSLDLSFQSMKPFVFYKKWFHQYCDNEEIPEEIAILEQFFTKINAVHGWTVVEKTTPLLIDWLIHDGPLNGFLFLLKQGFDPNKGSELFNGKALNIALQKKREPKLIEQLLAYGADVNDVDKVFKRTPLILASMFYPEWIEALLEKGASVNARDHSSWTALHWAIFQNPEGIDPLLRYGADLNVVPEGYSNILEFALKNGEGESFFLVQKYLANREKEKLSERIPDSQNTVKKQTFI